jgi:glycine reductase
MMSLDLASYDVHDLRLGRRTHLDKGVLEIDAAELVALLREDPAFDQVQVDVACPGESVRVLHLLDTVEPRIKIDPPGRDFPGLIGPPFTVGEGRTNRLAGVAVMQSAALPLSLGGLNVKEAILDMAGPGAAMTPFSQTLNVVLSFALRDGLSYREYDHAIRRAGLRASVYLAHTTIGLTPDRVDSLSLGATDARLPRVVYVSLLMQEGDVHHTFVYGRTIDETPSLLHPNEVLDGAVVNGDHHLAAYRNVTYFQQNHPVIQELYRRHGRDLTFGGVVIAKCLSFVYADKQRSASYAAKLARLLGSQGAVVTPGSGGHAAADLMLHCQELERSGIRTVLTSFEMAGDEGAEFGFVAFVPEADAVVSTGNMDELIDLPPVQRAIGGDVIIDVGEYEGGGGAPAIGRLHTALRRLYCCTTSVGPGRMTTRAA